MGMHAEKQRSSMEPASWLPDDDGNGRSLHSQKSPALKLLALCVLRPATAVGVLAMLICRQDEDHRHVRDRERHFDQLQRALRHDL